MTDLTSFGVRAGRRAPPHARRRLWRLRHVAIVERMIGDKPGTGGSVGAAYLRKTAERKFFPDLWELRSYLGDY
jgi:tryptophan 2,3-dioxygenase